MVAPAVSVVAALVLVAGRAPGSKTQARPMEVAPTTSSCIGCHAEQQTPLAKSRHGLAYSPGLAGQLPEEGPNRGSGLACLLCHAPAEDQRPWKTLAVPQPDGGPGLTRTEAQSLAISAAGVAANPHFDPHARALGVSCTACHLQGEAIVGTRAAPGAPHPVAADAALQSPALCAQCHQFGPAGAVNGKPLENTLVEFQASPWAKAGATCQSCHMPGGRHLFQGIHAPALVRASVEVRWTQRARGKGQLALTNAAVGHDFPTYATPRVLLAVQPLDARGTPVAEPVERVIGRQVRFVDGAWREDFDTRVAPGQTFALDYALALPPGAVRLRATVRVEPDASYISLYRDLLRAGGALPAKRRALIQDAQQSALGSGYRIFDETRNTIDP